MCYIATVCDSAVVEDLLPNPRVMSPNLSQAPLVLPVGNEWLSLFRYSKSTSGLAPYSNMPRYCSVALCLQVSLHQFSAGSTIMDDILSGDWCPQAEKKCKCSTIANVHDELSV